MTVAMSTSQEWSDFSGDYMEVNGQIPAPVTPDSQTIIIPIIIINTANFTRTSHPRRHQNVSGQNTSASASDPRERTISVSSQQDFEI